MPKVHFSVLVVEDIILYDLPHFKGDVLNNSIVQQGTFGRHFINIGSWNEAGSDEVMPHFGDVS